MTAERRILAIASLGLATVAVAATLGTGAASSRTATAVSETSTPAPSPATIPQPSLDPLPALTRRRLAPDDRRVDLAVPSFSDPTRITNPLFPIGRLRSAVIVGRFGGKPLRIETSLIPGTRTVDWNGGRIDTLQSQFLAFLDGRIYEVAVDKYAQDDAGAVWYLGEEAFSYRDGVVSDTGDTWLAGVDGPPAMIMPGHPRVGDVFRTENAPGKIFEQVTVERLGQTVRGPTGPVRGAMVGQELHIEGDVEDKTFAPGYGEFFSGLGRDYEATALAVPADAASGPTPAALRDLSRDAVAVAGAARAHAWSAAADVSARARTDWRAYRRTGAPRRLVAWTDRAVRGLTAAVTAHDSRRTALAALAVAEAGLDLQLRYRSADAVDLARLRLWTRRLAVDAAAGDRGAVDGDVRSLEWVRDRVTLRARDAGRIDDRLRFLRAAAEAGQLRAAAVAARRLRAAAAGVAPRP